MSNLTSKIKRRSWYALFVTGALCFACVGCGKSEPMGTVKGKVLLNDVPYANAAVAFTSLDTGRGGVAQIEPDGTFRIETPLLIGTYKVYLEPKFVEEEGHQPRPTSDDSAVPTKYWDESSSDISIDVKEGENDVTVPLVS
jgi:hypothetical protein